ncbi:MAG: hypothetical protein FD130_2217 [Halothiobacillaceae bacterium]|nr:MAG: hypothetical protein FD130_2217 [Halothiobacillaceae bacterium]
MKKKPEIIPGDRRLRKSWLIVAALYLLLLLWLEPLIDYLLLLTPLDRSADALNTLNQRKIYTTAIAFSVARSLPVLLFLWFGSQVLSAQRLPPRGMRLPFSVPVLEGVKARMVGMLIVVMSLIVLFREVILMVSAQVAW